MIVSFVLVTSLLPLEAVLEQHTQGLAGSKEGSVVQSSSTRLAECRVHVTAAACAEQAHDMTTVVSAIVNQLIEPFKKAPRFW